MKEFGVHVFPSPYSESIRQSVSVFHYSPVVEPPIDYNFRGKRRDTESSHNRINNIRKEADQQHPTESLQKRHRNERSRCNTIDEMVMVLDDLDSALRCAGFVVEEQLISKVITVLIIWIQKTAIPFDENPPFAHENNKEERLLLRTSGMSFLKHYTTFILRYAFHELSYHLKKDLKLRIAFRHRWHMFSHKRVSFRGLVLCQPVSILK
ncbi:unnamed protein product [Angiostrongylus costaricensis]|uniref:Transposase n=1 Tax=Angiostrongylus costaricensis TaxID=334426 RepID=A0A0R3PTZ0_ANGCS|nr:unnamed protein product [Angiostrongylus costaricensis]